MITVAQKGIPRLSNRMICKTLATKNNLKLAPTTLDKRKKEAPVL